MGKEAGIAPSRLSRLVVNLDRKPHPVMPMLRSLKVRVPERRQEKAIRNFIVNELPRIARYNPSCTVVLEKVPVGKGAVEVPATTVSCSFGDRSVEETHDVQVTLNGLGEEGMVARLEEEHSASAISVAAVLARGVNREKVLVEARRSESKRVADLLKQRRNRGRDAWALSRRRDRL